MRKHRTDASPRLDGDPARVRRLISDLETLRGHVLALEREQDTRIAAVHPAWEASARNLVHYLAVRARDMSALQGELAAFGLQTFERNEAHVMATLSAILRLLHRAAGLAEPLPEPFHHVVGFHEGESALRVHTEALLGTRPDGRYVRILVTLPSEAADDPDLVERLVAAGMDLARVNCAHDGPEAWDRMIRNVRAAARRHGRTCRVLMDLAGPKLRTGTLAPGPRVVKVSPGRDRLGRVVKRARLALVAAPGEGGVPVTPAFLATLKPGDRVLLLDARGRERLLDVIEAVAERVTVETDRTVYLVPGTALRRVPDARPPASEPPAVEGAESPEDLQGVVGDLPPLESSLVLRPGDLLVLTADPAPGRPAEALEGAAPTPARIPCSLPEVLADVRPGERIWFDDGKIGGIVERADPAEVQVRVVRAPPEGARLKADKGINLPDSQLRLEGLTPTDLADLDFVARKADLVALSFVRRPEDVHALQARLARLGARNMGIVVKVETCQALAALPAILLAAMRSHPVGVMIARGDLAIEYGFERLAEAQEEILWLCEACHVPVIWATQVLESLNRQGLPSRAEITDAASSIRAECVMLNKGTYLLDAVGALSDILQRTEARHDKSRALFRAPGWDAIDRPDDPFSERSG